MKNKAGFTLIEVLIALAILSIALTAVIRSTSQNIQDTHYLKSKTIATWVGTQIISEARLGLLQLPAEDETEMLGQKWAWKAEMIDTPNQHIKKINTQVYRASNHQKLSDLESYIYVN